MALEKRLIVALIGGIVGYFSSGVLFYSIGVGGKERIILAGIVAVVGIGIGYVVTPSSKEEVPVSRQDSRVQEQQTVNGQNNVEAQSQQNPRRKEIPDFKRVQLEKIAQRGPNSMFLLTLFIPSLGYYLVDRKGLAAVCLLTGHFGLTAHIIGPFHTRHIAKKARKQLREAQ